VGAGLGEIHRDATSPSPPVKPPIRTYETHSIHTFHVTRRIAKAPFTLERLAVAGHGGSAVIEWYCGSWSSLAANATDAVGIYLDGTEVAETVKGGRGGEYDTRAGILRWVGTLTARPHIILVRLEQSTGPVALPLVLAGSRVQEGAEVIENAQ
jgi:hypothetical protein